MKIVQYIKEAIAKVGGKSVKEGATEYGNDIYGEPIYEMSNLYKRKSGGLPMNLWIDDSGRWKSLNHKLPRLKFQPDRGESTSQLEHKGIPMEISDNPDIPESVKKHNPKHDFSENEIELLRKFIRKYKNELLRVSDPDDSEFDFGDFLEYIKDNPWNV